MKHIIREYNASVSIHMYRNEMNFVMKVKSVYWDHLRIISTFTWAEQVNVNVNGGITITTYTIYRIERCYGYRAMYMDNRVNECNVFFSFSMKKVSFIYLFTSFLIDFDF